LRHLAKYRPDWIIDYVADPGRYSAAIGHVRHALTYADPLPMDRMRYDREIDVKLYDTFSAWTDRPNTRVVSCLHEKFGMPWDRECGGYVVNVTDEARAAALEFFGHLDVRLLQKGQRCKVVAIQYQGDCWTDRKNLTHGQAAQICYRVSELGRVPLLLDWRNTSPITATMPEVRTVGKLPHADAWGRDAQMNSAIIQQCEAFIGIDSGPGKCASAVGTPALICWTKLHPALFHDPCETTTHLVPGNHRDMDLLQGKGGVPGDGGVGDWFEANYRWRTYEAGYGKVKMAGEMYEMMPMGDGRGGLVDEVGEWLRETLR
jgi:hypothetical protein